MYAAHLAKMINNFKNVKHKLLKTNAAFWFNKICLKKSTPKYINITIKVAKHKIKISGVCGWRRFYTNIKNVAQQGVWL
jgi:hypothetical protein